MDKNILIEVFKSELYNDVQLAISKNAFRLEISKYNHAFYSINVYKQAKKHYIDYRNIAFEITKYEYDELLLMCRNKIDETDRNAYIENSNFIMELYKNAITKKRNVLVEKMNKDILIEIFKSKACINDISVPKSYGALHQLEFWIKSGNFIDDLVDVHICEKNNQYYIKYETVLFDITKCEYDELLLLYAAKKKHIDKIKEEEDRQTYIKNTKSLMEMYQQIVTQKRNVLIEKTNIQK